MFFKLLTRRTYLDTSEENSTLLSTKTFVSKYLINAYIGADADGSLRVPISVIRKLCNSRCFRYGKIPRYVENFSNDTAW